MNSHHPSTAGGSGAPAWLDRLKVRLADRGLNLLGVASPESYDGAVGPQRQSEVLLKGTRAILVAGSGGSALWRHFRERLAADPRVLTDHPHPIDQLVREIVGHADAALGGVVHRWFFAAAETDVHLDFRVLGHLAGLGGRSRLGLLLHPEYGLWVGLRAACFVAEALPATGPDQSDPCAGCPGYCVEACPGGAFPDGTWDVDRCAEFHHEAATCRTSCRSRMACPKGAQHRYP